MVQKCIKCGEPVAKIPIFRYREDGKKTILWKNLFKVSWDTIILIVIIGLLVTAYKKDTATCMDIVGDPLKFCNESNACKVLAEQQLIHNEPKIPVHLDFNFTIKNED